MTGLNWQVAKFKFRVAKFESLAKHELKLHLRLPTFAIAEGRTQAQLKVRIPELKIVTMPLLTSLTQEQH